MYTDPLRRDFDSFGGALSAIAFFDVWAPARYSLRISSHVSRLIGMAIESGAQTEIADS
jgi:hypothetical protein